MATHPSILAWEIPWTDALGKLQIQGVTKQLDTTWQLNNNRISNRYFHISMDGSNAYTVARCAFYGSKTTGVCVYVLESCPSLFSFPISLSDDFTWDLWTECANWWPCSHQCAAEPPERSLVRINNQKKKIFMKHLSKELTLDCPKICFPHVVSFQFKSLKVTIRLEKLFFINAKSELILGQIRRVPGCETLVVIPSDWNARAENPQFSRESSQSLSQRLTWHEHEFPFWRQSSVRLLVLQCKSN